MLNKLASSIAKTLLNNKIIDLSNIDVYIYGLELIIAYCFYFAILILNSILTRTILESILFCLGFMLLRRFAGGFHMSTYLRCQVLFIINQYAFIVLIKMLPTIAYDYVLTVMLGVSILIIWIFAPVDHKNRRFNQREKIYFRRISCLYSFAIILVVVLLQNYSQLLVLSYLIGVFSASCSIVAGYIQQRRN